jgi:RNA polymerase sigma-70 factor (ECF subfamily)
MTARPRFGPSSTADEAYIAAPKPDGKGVVHDLDEARRRVEAALVTVAQQGDQDAFAELYRRIRPAVYRLASFHAGESAAEDIVAETFARVWNGLPRYRDTGAPFAAWVYGIARHVAIDEVRKGARSDTSGELPDQAVANRDEDHVALATAIDRLPAEQRLVIELKYFVGLTNAEVAAAVGGTPGSVNAKQWRALRALRGLLDEGGDG